MNFMDAKVTAIEVAIIIGWLHIYPTHTHTQKGSWLHVHFMSNSIERQLLLK